MQFIVLVVKKNGGMGGGVGLISEGAGGGLMEDLGCLTGMKTRLLFGGNISCLPLAKLPKCPSKLASSVELLKEGEKRQYSIILIIIYWKQTIRFVRGGGFVFF